MRDYTGIGMLHPLVAVALLPSVLGIPSKTRPHDTRAPPGGPGPQVITGLHGTSTAGAQIVIHDAAGRPSWSWSVQDGKDVSPELRACLYDVCRGTGCAATENKWANGGDSVLAVHGGAAIIINHHPGRLTDKAVTFGICLNRDGMENTHSAEMLPDGKVAIATTSNGMTGNIKIFDVSKAQAVQAAPVQQLDGIPAVHALLWDEQSSVLWAAGNDRSPLVDGSTSILNAYRYDNGRFRTRHESHIISRPVRLTTEWGAGTPWWDGSHDMTPIPDERRLLITTDLDVHVYDMDSQTFEHGEAVARQYLQGFQPLGARRGPDGVFLPRSDIKSIGILENGDTVYVQAQWGRVSGDHVGHISGGMRQQDIRNQALYRSRWFTETAW